MLASEVVVVGHISIDHVECSQGVRIQPGGAALYTALAAKTLLRNVALVSAIGRDFEFTEALRSFNMKYVKAFNLPSTRFHIKYNKRGKAHYVKSKHGAASRISASSIPKDLLNTSSFIHLCPMKPKKLAKIFAKIRENSPQTKVSLNTWVGYIRKSSKNRTIIKKVARDSDFFILNDTEAKILTRTNSIVSALENLKGKTIIITLGELGALVRGEEIGTQMIPALNIASKIPIDFTGAGDTWCGAFIAAYRITNDLVRAVTVASMIASLKCLGWGFERIANLRFRNTDDVLQYILGLKEGSLQKKISDYAL